MKSLVEFIAENKQASNQISVDEWLKKNGLESKTEIRDNQLIVTSKNERITSRLIENFPLSKPFDMIICDDERGKLVIDHLKKGDLNKLTKGIQCKEISIWSSPIENCEFRGEILSVGTIDNYDTSEFYECKFEGFNHVKILGKNTEEKFKNCKINLDKECKIDIDMNITPLKLVNTLQSILKMDLEYEDDATPAIDIYKANSSNIFTKPLLKYFGLDERTEPKFNLLSEYDNNGRALEVKIDKNGVVADYIL